MALRIYKTAMYLRISQKDEEKNISRSIINQKKLLSHFIDSLPDLLLTDIYADDGKTGTNFERPEFKRLMKDAEKGAIDCIVVKDFSRLGRNFTEAGRLIETVFPYMGIRFISVSDNYDSNLINNSDSFIMPVKNLMNEKYSFDISQKEKTAKRSMMKKGMYVGSVASYGYKKTDKNVLETDWEAAENVRRIFFLFAEGKSCYKIAKIFNSEGILPPREYKIRKRNVPDLKNDRKCQWNEGTVKAILKNPIYTGCLVQNKTTSIKPKGKMKRLSEDEWIRCENTHEAIVSRECFEKVQKIFDKRSKNNKQADNLPDKISALKIVFCGFCGRKMMYKRYKEKNTYRHYYICSSNQSGGICQNHKIINADTVESSLMLLTSLFLKINDTTGKFAVSVVKKQINALEKNNKHKAEAYLKLKKGIISKKEYIRILEEIKLNEANESFNKSKSGLNGFDNNCLAMSSEFLKYIAATIYVYGNERIEIIFNIKDLFFGI